MRYQPWIQEGVLLRSVYMNGEYMDYALWTTLAEDWLEGRREFTLPLFH